MSKTDKERIDYLQHLTDEARYTGKVVLRSSAIGRGWRLHETSKPDGVVNVRDTIDHAMNHGIYPKK